MCIVLACTFHDTEKVGVGDECVGVGVRGMRSTFSRIYDTLLRLLCPWLLSGGNAFQWVSRWKRTGGVDRSGWKALHPSSVSWNRVAIVCDWSQAAHAVPLCYLCEFIAKAAFLTANYNLKLINHRFCTHTHMRDRWRCRHTSRWFIHLSIIHLTKIPIQACPCFQWKHYHFTNPHWSIVTAKHSTSKNLVPCFSQRCKDTKSSSDSANEKLVRTPPVKRQWVPVLLQPSAAVACSSSAIYPWTQALSSTYASGLKASCV